MQPLLLGVLSGVLLGLSLPPFDLEWLGWVALVPLLAGVRERRPLEATGLGIVAGISAGLPQAVLSLPFVLLAAVLGVVALVAERARRHGQDLRWVLFIARAGVSAEWLTTFLPMPIHLALSQHRALPVIQVAAYTGIWGVSFLLWWTNAALADALLLRRFPTPAMTLGGVLLAVTLAAGMLSLKSVAVQHATDRSAHRLLRVAAVQDRTMEERADLSKPVPPQLEGPDRETLTRQARDQDARLIVWTEECLGTDFDPASAGDPTRALARELGVFLVPGYSQPAQPRPFNCAALIGEDGAVLGVYRKHHLFSDERGSVAPGGGATAYATPLGRVGMEICFDNCFTGVTRRLAAAGAQIIAVPNYDPPTPHALLHRLHATITPFRAVENHVPMVRADPTGLSQIVDSCGRIVAEAPLDVATALVADVVPGDGRGTPFTLLGDWLAYLCLAGVGAFVSGTLVMPRWVARRKGKEGERDPIGTAAARPEEP